MRCRAKRWKLISQTDFLQDPGQSTPATPRLVSVTPTFAVLVLLAGFVGLVAFTGLTGCGSSLRITFDGLRLEAETPYHSPYNWDTLLCTDGRFVYQEDGVTVSRTGLDVSSHQGVIDWPAVASDGIEFAFIRVGNRGFSEGQIYLDEQFESNYQGARGAGIFTGAYFFSQAITESEAREEAQFVLERLAGRTLDYPIAYDLEPVSEASGRTNHLSTHDRTSNALAFCDVIEAAGYSTIIYGNAKDIAGYYREALGGRAIWFAEYDAAYPKGQFDFAIWQYSSSGQVAGITTNVDLNIEFYARKSSNI